MANYSVLYTGGNNSTLNFNNSNILFGNVGIGGNGKFAGAGGCTPSPCIINGGIDFAAAEQTPSQFKDSGDDIRGGVHYSVADVATALANLSSLTTTLANDAGNSLTINAGKGQKQVIKASAGKQQGTSGIYVFDVTSLHFGNGATLSIQNDTGNPNASVVFDVASSVNPQFGGAITLTGFSMDQVLFNIEGGTTLQINTNGEVENADFLDYGGPISINHSVLQGRLLGGDSVNMQIVSGAEIVPEPAYSGCLLLGMVVTAGLVHRKRRAHIS